ncbi:MAG: hypothetical protein SFT92_02030 [Rickettsiales bacterium]|nr:hypothetical protein [Rickettsiales bacterium]
MNQMPPTGTSPDMTYIPAGHPAAEPGKSAGGCPFKQLFTALGEGADTLPDPKLGERLAEIGDYATTLQYLTHPNSSVAKHYGFNDYRSTRSFSVSLADKKPAAPGVETYMHTLHTQLRLMTSRIGHLLDVDSLTPESGHGITKNIAQMIAQYNDAAEVLKTTTETIVAKADAAYARNTDKVSSQLDHERKHGVISSEWLRGCLGSAQGREAEYRLIELTENMSERYKAVIVQLNKLEEVPIKTKQGTRWVTNDPIGVQLYQGSVAMGLWQLTLSSDSQIDSTKVGFMPDPDENSYIRESLTNEAGATTSIITRSIVPLVGYLHKKVHHEIEGIINNGANAIRKATQDHRYTLTGLMTLNEVIPYGYSRSQRRDWTRLTKHLPNPEEYLITPREMIQMLSFFAKEHPHEDSIPDFEPIIKTLSALPPNDVGLLIKTCNEHPEWKIMLSKLRIFPQYQKAELLDTALEGLFNPKERTANHMEAAR